MSGYRILVLTEVEHVELMRVLQYVGGDIASGALPVNTNVPGHVRAARYEPRPSTWLSECRKEQDRTIKYERNAHTKDTRT